MVASAPNVDGPRCDGDSKNGTGGCIVSAQSCGWTGAEKWARRGAGGNMPLADTLPATLHQCGPHLLANARNRIDPSWIEEALAKSGMMPVRRRKLPADVVVWLILGASLIAGMAFDHVVRYLGLTAPTRRASAQLPPNSGAVADARARLGDAVMRELFGIVSGHWRNLEDFTHLRFHGLIVLAADGFALRTPDTASNVAEFGKPSSRRGAAAFPVVSAAETGDTGWRGRRGASARRSWRSSRTGTSGSRSR